MENEFYSEQPEETSWSSPLDLAFGIVAGIVTILIIIKIIKFYKK